MTEEKAEQMLAFFANEIDFENIPLDDANTYELFQRADTDGIFMFESDWDKYDLRQIKPKNMEKLTSTMAFSHGLAVNPYIYSYLKIRAIHRQYVASIHGSNMTIPRIAYIRQVSSISLAYHYCLSEFTLNTIRNEPSLKLVLVILNVPISLVDSTC